MHFSLANLVFFSKHLSLAAQWYFKTLYSTLLGVVNNSPHQKEHLIIINIYCNLLKIRSIYVYDKDYITKSKKRRMYLSQVVFSRISIGASSV